MSSEEIVGETAETLQTTAIHIPDEDLYKDAERLREKVVIITGASNGIGKETALKMGSYGAKIVIGDRDSAGAEKVVQAIKDAGGQAAFIKCNVMVFEDVVALYELAFNTYGSVDVVIPNAGVTELGTKLCEVEYDNGGKPRPPNWRTLDVNLYGVFNTLHLSRNYLLKTPGDLKAVVLLGSIASWLGIPGAPQYAASKHGVLGTMRALHPIFERLGIRIATIHPFFADTGIVPLPVKLFLSGIPLVPVPRVAGAITYAATNPDPETSGCAYMLLDNGPVFKIPKEEFKLGVYGMLDKRVNVLLKPIGWFVTIVRLFSLLKAPVLLLTAFTAVAWGVYVQFGTHL